MKYWIKLRFCQTPKLYTIALIIIFAELIVIIGNSIKLLRPDIGRYLVSDRSCYYAKEGDALPSTEDPSFSPKNRSIFFHETSCRGELTPRQACSIETAARKHPQSEIYVLFSAPITEVILKGRCFAKLFQLQNVKLARVHIAEYAKGTIVESLLEDLEDSRHPVVHASDILRILTLNKWGGIYLDTDMLVAQTMEKLPANWIVERSDGFVPSSILSFAKDEVGTNVTNAILEEIFKSYDPYDWSIYARAVQKVIQRLCPRVIFSGRCGELTILPYELFYPLHYTLWKLYFKVGAFTNFEPPYTYHMWNRLSYNQVIEKDTPYEMLARKHCPSIYEMYGDQFDIKI